MIKQNDYETEVEEQQHRQHPPEPLARVEDIDRIRPQVRPRAENEEATYDSPPPIFFLKAQNESYSKKILRTYVDFLSFDRVREEIVVILVVVVKSRSPNVAHYEHE